MSDLQVPEMTQENYADFCHACGGYFPEDGTVYFRICGECWHCWPTETDLVQHMMEVDRLYDIAPTMPRAIEEILSCPCCAHDF